MSYGAARMKAKPLPSWLSRLPESVAHRPGSSLARTAASPGVDRPMYRRTFITMLARDLTDPVAYYSGGTTCRCQKARGEGHLLQRFDKLGNKGSLTYTCTATQDKCIARVVTQKIRVGV